MMKTMEQGAVSVMDAACEQVIAAKTKILHALHTFCQEREIRYFAVENLARAAETGAAMSEAEIQAVWKVGMVRRDYERFLREAQDGAFLLNDKRNGCVELSVEGAVGEHISLVPYDALPTGLKDNRNFVALMRKKNREHAMALENNPQCVGKAYADLCACAQTYAEDESAVMVAPLIGAEGQQFNRALLYPTKNRKFYDILICVPADCSIWTVTASRKLGEQKLEILRELDQFCAAQELPYFAISKLEISTRMYGDLMPGFGSSAMEVGMLRRDYDALREKLAGESKFVAYDTDKNGRHDGAIRITLSAYVKDDNRPGAVLSVVPYDFLPAEEGERKHFLAKMKELNAAYADAVKQEEEAQAARLYEQIIAEATRYNGQEEGLRRISRVQCGQSKVLPYHHVYPVVRSKIANFELNAPCNPYIWADKTNVDYNNAANAHKTEILKRLNHVCESYALTSFAIADLLIGTVTYADYVPNKPAANWDLALLRRDYDRLITLLRERAGEYGLQLLEYRDGAMRCPKATKTVAMQELSWPEGEIRLVPFDKMPEAYDTQYAFLRKLRRLNRLFKQLADHEMLGQCDLSEKELKKAYKKYGSDALNTLYQKIDKLAQSYNDDKDTHLYGRMALEKSKFITEDALFPLEKSSFRDIGINRPHDYSVWTPVIDEALHIQVTSIQQADMLLIDKVDEICRKLNIGYFVCGGSMLGYMRHGGFIPWDDDIDVGMLRSDYDRFMREAEPFLDERFFLQTRQKDPSIPYLFSKLRLNNTEYITEYNEHRAFHKGICLDIFPFDYIPNDPDAQEDFKDEVIRRSKAHNRIVNNQRPEPIDPIKPRNLRERYYHWYGKLKRWYFHRRSLKKTQQAYLNEATKFNGRVEELGLTTVASFVPSYTYIKVDDLLPYQDVLFDGHTVKVPKRPDIFLTMQYGDYLQLPPKHNQVAHRLVRWSVDVKADEEKRQAAAAK